jgi:hypothetical protein
VSRKPVNLQCTRPCQRDSFGLFAKVSAYVDSATCPVCDLTLSQAELVLTDIDFVLDLGQDGTTADEEEGWRDARDEEGREMRGDYELADYAGDWMDDEEDSGA